MKTAQMNRNRLNVLSEDNTPKKTYRDPNRGPHGPHRGPHGGYREYQNTNNLYKPFELVDYKTMLGVEKWADVEE